MHIEIRPQIEAITHDNLFNFLSIMSESMKSL